MSTSNVSPQMDPGHDDSEWTEQTLFRVLLHLEGGDWLEDASFATEEEAEARARAVVAALREGEWPRVLGSYLRPETIVSVEVSERRRMTGSTERAR